VADHEQIDERRGFPDNQADGAGVAIVPFHGGIVRSLLRFASQQGGASSAEYALILAIIGAAIAIAAANLGGVIGGSINGSADCIDDKGTC